MTCSRCETYLVKMHGPWGTTVACRADLEKTFFRSEEPQYYRGVCDLPNSDGLENI